MIRPLGAGWARERLVLDGVITVIDVMRAKRALEFDVAVEQLGFADVVVLSHVDEAGEAAMYRSLSHGSAQLVDSTESTPKLAVAGDQLRNGMYPKVFHERRVEARVAAAEDQGELPVR